MATASHLGKIIWVPEIGDPTAIGWFTVAVYFIVALTCLRAAFLSKKNQSIKRFWLFLSFFLIALGINKQLDLQTLFTLIGKNLAIEQGWYKDRHIFQLGFIILISLLSLLGLTVLFTKFKNADIEIKITLTGVVILFAFILIRASSFHHMDIFINMELASTKINWMLELGSLFIIFAGSFKYIQRKNNAK